MGGLQVEVEAAEVGFDQKRLDRIDKHFARYVDDHKLADWVSLCVNRLEASLKERWPVPCYDDCRYIYHERKSSIYKSR